ncbi:MAG: ATP synthase F0 subunit C [Planctomycetes bacterium]|nr:ATP synthase F0 subunit C [Planctomycetota bacterium]
MLDLMGSVLAEVVLDAESFKSFGAVIACGIIIVGASMGISRIANGATEAIARQPEAGGRIFTSMLLAAALIEGVTFFALIICLLSS